MLKMFLVLF